MIKKIFWAIGIAIICLGLMGNVWAQEYVPFSKSAGKPESGYVKWHNKGATTYTTARDSVMIVTADSCYSSIYEAAGNNCVQVRLIDRSATNDSVNVGIEVLGAIPVAGLKVEDSDFKRIYYLKPTMIKTTADSIQVQGWNQPFDLYLDNCNLYRFMAYPLKDNDKKGNVVLRMKINRVNY